MNLLFQLRLCRLGHFIRWLTDPVREEASGTSHSSALSSLCCFYLFILLLKHFFLPLWSLIYVARKVLAAWQCLGYHAPSALTPGSAAHTWPNGLEQGNVLLLNFVSGYILSWERGERAGMTFFVLSRLSFNVSFSQDWKDF